MGTFTRALQIRDWYLGASQKGYLFQASCNKNVGILLIEEYQRVRKSVDSICKGLRRAKRCISLLGIGRENVLVCDSFIFNTAVKRDAKFQARCEKDTICQ